MMVGIWIDKQSHQSLQIKFYREYKIKIDTHQRLLLN